MTEARIDRDLHSQNGVSVARSWCDRCGGRNFSSLREAVRHRLWMTGMGLAVGGAITYELLRCRPLLQSVR